MAATMVQKFLVLSLLLLGASAEKVYPCPDFDNECVGAYLEESSSCLVDSLPTDVSSLDPYALDYFYFETPYFNVTEDRTNITIVGHNQTYVQDFYYDTDTNEAMLSIFCPFISFEGDSNVKWHFPNEATPINFTTHYKVAFTNMTLTTVFPDYTSLELSTSKTYSYIPIPPTYDNGDGVEEAIAANPLVATLSNAWNTLPNVATLEAFVYRGPALVRLFTNYMLCYYECSE